MSDTTTEAPAVETPEVETPEAPKEQSVSQKRRAAYSAAETRLREKYADEFKALVNEEAANRGVTYTFRKTEEERAREKYAELLAQFPDLATPQPLPAG